MTEPKITDEDFDVLDLVAKNEPVRSKTLTENIYWADSTKDINYRLQKLEDHGLVEREEVPDSQYPVNPKQAWITEDGHKRLATLEDSAPRTLEERVEKMEKQVGRMRETYGKIKQRVVRIENRLDELEDGVDDDLDALGEDIRNIKRNLDDGPLIDADEMTFGDDD